ncbi:histone-lysine N-methyltransferase SETMAR [Trichonephila clavipes]|nr:histone-lysine N-methyltransferase SETMAR [Trichonephila clavipes]
MPTVFWDTSGVILIEYQKRGHTINASRYSAPLAKLREAIRRKRSGLLTEGVILLYDIVTPRTSRQTQELLRKFRWKKHLSKTSPYSSDGDVQTAAENWLNEQGPGNYQDELNKLIQWSDKCLNSRLKLSACRSLPANQPESNHTINLNLLSAPSMYLLAQ